MATLPFGERQHILARALFVGHRIDLRGLDDGRLAEAPLVIPTRDGGAAVVFRYGAIVLFNLPAKQEAEFLQTLAPRIVEAFDKPAEDEVELRIVPGTKERAANNAVLLHEWSVARLQVVADVLAKSVVLVHYEDQLANRFDRIEPIAAGLMHTGRATPTGRELTRHMANALLAQTKMVGRVEVSEKPEVLWEQPDLELLYQRLADEYELAERHVALDRKLDVVSRTAETLLQLQQHDRSLRVEWYIVVLILVEIGLTLYELWAS